MNNEGGESPVQGLLLVPHLHPSSQAVHLPASCQEYWLLAAPSWPHLHLWRLAFGRTGAPWPESLQPPAPDPKAQSVILGYESWPFGLEE